MAFVRYDESIYRTGHRMFGLTDPFTASHGLSGINHSYGGFGPWMLHGGDQPFTERGGEHLSGLGALVPDGSTVTYRGKWVPTYTIGAQDLVSAVSQALADKWGLQVANVQSDAGVADSTILGMTWQPTPFNVTMQIFVRTGKGGYGDPSDIVGIVRGEVYAASGQMPLADSAPAVQTPGGPAQGTGQPPGPGAPCTFYDPSNPNCAQTPSDWGAWLQSNAIWIGLGIVGLAVLPRLIGGR
jgi:hypothetical protein